LNIKQIGITGSRGFIGSQLVNNLQKIFPDNCIIPFDPRVENIPPQLDILYHLGFNQSMKYNQNFSDALSTDLKISEKLANYCKRNKTTLIFTSSSAVYAPSPLPVMEDDKIGPITPYGKAKNEVEQLFEDFSSTSNFSLIILRLFNPFGPGQPKEFVISQIIDALINKTSLTIQHPNSGRDFIYIDDCISALIKMSILEVGSITINIGTGVETKINGLVEIIGNLMKENYKNYIVFNSKLSTAHSVSIANIGRMYNMLNLELLTPLRIGIKNILQNKLQLR
jgi:nucleoside-diphosphate-sugar epimerase